MRSWATILVLIPFFLFEKASNAEVEKLLNGDASRAAIAIAICDPRLGCLFACVRGAHWSLLAFLASCALPDIAILLARDGRRVDPSA